MKKIEMKTRFDISLITILLLLICLTTTTLALVYASISVDNNLFHTGVVKLELYNSNNQKLDRNDPLFKNNKIITQEYLYEPGATLENIFYLVNLSSCDIYYRMYLDNVDGGLEDIIDVKIYEIDENGDKVLLAACKAKDLNAEEFDPMFWSKPLNKVDSIKNYAISFHFPEIGGNEYKNKQLTFSFVADATQTKNNPNKEF